MSQSFKQVAVLLVRYPSKHRWSRETERRNRYVESVGRNGNYIAIVIVADNGRQF